MTDAVEKFMEIIDQDVPIPPKFAIKLVQMSFQASESVVNAFSFLTGRVIRNQPRTKNGSEQVVTQTTLHHALRDMNRTDVPVFPALKNVKLDKSVAFPCATQQFALSYAHIDKCVLFVGLGRMFPAYAAPTFFIGGIQVSKSEYVSKLNFQGNLAGSGLARKRPRLGDIYPCGRVRRSLRAWTDFGKRLLCLPIAQSEANAAAAAGADAAAAAAAHTAKARGVGRTRGRQRARLRPAEFTVPNP